MKRIDLKSLAAGIILGTVGITTAFAATGIQSAALSDAKVTLNGASLPLSTPLVSVTMDNEEAPQLYASVDDLLGKLGYVVAYDAADNTVSLTTSGSRTPEGPGAIPSQGDVVLHLANHADQRNISESGAFQADDGQTLLLTITSDIQGGTVDLFLSGPNGQEQRITIGSQDTTAEIALAKGLWQYNCSGIFPEGGDLAIVGTIR